MAENLLSIDSSVEPDFVKIDGERYDLITVDDLSIVDQHVVMRSGKRMQILWEKEELSGDDVAELEKISDGLFRLVAPGIPDHVSARLKTNQKSRIANAFFLKFAEEQGFQTSDRQQQISETGKS